MVSGLPCLRLGAGQSDATLVIACVEAAHLAPQRTYGLSRGEAASRRTHIGDAMSAPLPEESAQQLGGARFVDAAIDLGTVVTSRLLEEARAVLDGAALGIAGAEIEAAQAREGDGGGTHGA